MCAMQERTALIVATHSAIPQRTAWGRTMLRVLGLVKVVRTKLWVGLTSVTVCAFLFTISRTSRVGIETTTLWAFASLCTAETSKYVTTSAVPVFLDANAIAPASGPSDVTTSF